MTAAEQHALEQIYAATITPEEWANRIENGYHGKPYKFRDTRYFQALVELRKAGAGGGPSPGGGPTPTPTPANRLEKQIQNVIYCAQEPLAALGCLPWFKPALTADPGYASFVTPYVVSVLRSHFGTVGAWFVQTQVSVDHARQFVAQYGLDFLIFQGETEEEFRTAIDLGARLMVGNANAWTDLQRAAAINRCNAGTLAFAQEAYTNLGNPWPENTSSGGVPAASFVIGVYDGSNEVPGHGWYPTVADYKAHTPPGAWAGISIYHAAGVRDWDNL